MPELSIIIPSLNEEFLGKTLEDLLSHTGSETEIICVLDGWKPTYELPKDLRIKYIHFEKSQGQRRATNLAVKESIAKFVMKTDSHCSFAPNFDTQLLKDIKDNMVMTALMCRLHAFDWLCSCGKRQYQDHKPESCHEWKKEIIWNIAPKPFTKRYSFDTNMVFQYEKHQEETEELVETLALQGSMFMVSRENYWKWNLCDENFGSWGFQGVETALKCWFNGGTVVTNKNTFYGHMFRTEDIPYERTKEQVEIAHEKARQFLKHPKFPEIIRHFDFPQDWSEEKLKELCG